MAYHHMPLQQRRLTYDGSVEHLIHHDERVIPDESAVDDQPEIVQHHQPIARSDECVIRVKSDERGATLTLGSKWIQLTKDGFLSLKHVVNIVDSNIDKGVQDKIRIQDGIYACTSFYRNT
jgi:hypothetical protein